MKQKKSKTLTALLVFWVATIGQLAMAAITDTETNHGLYAMNNTEDWDLSSLTQDTDGSYQIWTDTDWNNLADYVKAGNTCEGFAFILMDNISVSTPIGYQLTSEENSRMRFAGTFNGNGKTLTVNLNSNNIGPNHNYCAPFAYVDKFTVSNLHVDGTITTDGYFASGLCGSATGMTTIQNCHVSTTISVSSTFSRNGNHGGFIGVAENGSSFTNCWFDGSFTGNNFKYTGGFVGINKKSATLINCLFNPQGINASNAEGACTFIHSEKTSDALSLTDVYYVTPFGELQGEEVLEQEPTDGSVCQSVEYVDGHTYYLVIGNPEWRKLQADINTVETEITLTADVSAAKADVALVVPAGRDVTINLEGFNINRNLNVVKANGSVIVVEAGAHLTLVGNTVTGGTITGGYNSANGGGIINEGELELTNITVTGNKTNGKGGGIFNGENATLNIQDCHINGNDTKVNNGGFGAGIYVAGGEVTIESSEIASNNGQNQGGGIYVNAGQVNAVDCVIKENKSWAKATGGGVFINGGTFSMTNGSVTGNMGTKGNKLDMRGAGVYVDNGVFKLSGNVVIKNNHFSSDPLVISNVFLKKDRVINIDDALGNAEIFVTMERLGTITEGLSGNGSYQLFFSDVKDYMVGVNADGDAIMANLVLSNDDSVNETKNSTLIATKDGTNNAIVNLPDRTLFKDGSWNTICLPFNLTLKGSILEGAVAKTLIGATMTGDDVELMFGDPAQELQAGVPYIIMWDSGDDIVNPVFSNVTINSTAPQTITSDDECTQFIGYYDAFLIDASDTDIYYMTANNTLKHTAKERTLKSCRAYFRFTENGGGGDVKELTFNIDFGDDTPTGIKVVKATEENGFNQGVIYNLSGQRVKTPTSGIYIVNGKKVMIK